MSMKKIVIIGANDFQNQLILKAKSMGYETHVFAWQCGDVGEETADYFYPVSIVEKDTILEECRKINPEGICTIASDLAATTVSYVADALGLPCNPFASNLIQTNKYAMRKALSDAGIPCPHFAERKSGESVEDIDFTFPLIVKPTDRSGSRSIWKVEKKEDLASAIVDACNSSFEKKAIIEEYITGPEYSCECISYHGEHHFLAFTQKFTTGAPHFIETGHTEPSNIPAAYQEEIISDIYRALDALKIENGASHTEFRLQEDGTIRIIEIGARMGGDCIGSDLVYYSTGYDFVKMVIDVACGLKPDFHQYVEPCAVSIHFMFTEEDVETMRQIEKEHPEKMIRISQLDFSHEGNVTDSSTRIGYYLMRN